MYFEYLTWFSFFFLFPLNFILLNVFIHTKYAFYSEKKTIIKTITFLYLFVFVFLIIFVKNVDISPFLLIFLYFTFIGFFYFMLPLLFLYISIQSNEPGRLRKCFLNKKSIYSILLFLLFISLFVFLFVFFNKIEYMNKFDKEMYSEFLFLIYMFLLNIIGSMNFVYYFTKILNKFHKNID